MKGEKTHAGVGSLTQDVSGQRDGKLVLSGVHVSTTVVEYSTDNFNTVEVLPLVKADGSIVASLTANATVRYRIPPEKGKVRVRISAYTSGSPKHVNTLY